MLEFKFNPVSGAFDYVREEVGSPLYFGAGAINSSLTARYLYPGYSDQIAEIVASSTRVVRSGNLQNLRVIHNVLGSPTVVLTYTVFINDVPSGLAAGVAADSLLGANTTTLVPVVAGDRISVRVSRPSAILSPRKIHVSMEVI